MFSYFVKLFDTLSLSSRIVYLSTKPEPGTAALHTVYREFDKAVQKKMSGTTPSVHTFFENWTLLTKKDHYANDGLHLSKAGYRCWQRALEELLARGGEEGWFEMLEEC